MDTLYNREGLARYILACSQSKTGGLRDKPGKYVVFTLVLSLTNSGLKLRWPADILIRTILAMP